MPLLFIGVVCFGGPDETALAAPHPPRAQAPPGRAQQQAAPLVWCQHDSKGVWVLLLEMLMQLGEQTPPFPPALELWV